MRRMRNWNVAESKFCKLGEIVKHSENTECTEYRKIGIERESESRVCVFNNVSI